MNKVVKVIIPAYNEEESIAKVIGDIPMNVVKEVVVVNNASTDKTQCKAEEAGATVLFEETPGYGAACLNGMKYISSLRNDLPDIVVFIDGDYSDYPEEMIKLIQQITEYDYDLVIGSRSLGDREAGSMTFPQIFGNWLATNLLALFYGIKFTDLGPFRAIKYDSLMALSMIDTNYGWTVEMQLKAAKTKLKCTEVPVKYRKRIGFSKISGTLKGTIMAGYKILWTIFKYI